MHRLALILAFVAFWLISVTAYESPLRLEENDSRPEALHEVVQAV